MVKTMTHLPVSFFSPYLMEGGCLRNTSVHNGFPCQLQLKPCWIWPMVVDNTHNEIVHSLKLKRGGHIRTTWTLFLNAVQMYTVVLFFSFVVKKVVANVVRGGVVP